MAHMREAANVSDQRPLFLPAARAQFKMLSQGGGPGEQAFLFDRFDRGAAPRRKKQGARSRLPPSAPTPGASMISARPVTAAMGMPPPRISPW